MSRILICGDSNSLGEWGTVIPGPAVANNDHPEIFKPYNKEEYLKEEFTIKMKTLFPNVTITDEENFRAEITS